MVNAVEILACREMLLKLSDCPCNANLPLEICEKVNALKSSLIAVVNDYKGHIIPKSSVSKKTMGKIVRYVYSSTALILGRITGVESLYYTLNYGENTKYDIVANLIAKGKISRTKYYNSRAESFSKWAKYFVDNIMSDELFSALAYKYEQEKFMAFQSVNKIQLSLFENELIAAYPRVYQFLIS